MAYDILSRVSREKDFKSFKAQDVRSSYFKEEDNNILIPKVGLSFEKAGTYIIELNLNLKIKNNRNINVFYLIYKHNQIDYHKNGSFISASLQVNIKSTMRFDVQSNDTLDIKLVGNSVKYEDIFESFTGSFIDIYYINYLVLPKADF